MLQRYPDAPAYSPEIFRFWGTYFVILIPVSIIAKILIAIFFSIGNAIATREVESVMTDERDKLFELKALRNSLYVFALGFVVAMASLVFDMPPTIMFIILIGAGIVSEIVGDVSQFHFYRRGS
jgi:hypothetical protein